MKSENINNILKTRYDIDLLRGPIDIDHLRAVYEHYSSQRSMMRQTLGESAIATSPYSKAYLISEAALIILREIAPKRKKSKGVK